MIGDSTPKETARSRATRKWHNNAVKRHIQECEDEHEAIIQKPKTSKIRMAILQIFETKTNESVRLYAIAIHEKHKQLLREKLKRLRAEHNE